MTTNNWGRKYWFVLITAAKQIGREPNSRRDFRNLIYSMATLLPCPKCCNHWLEQVVKPKLLEEKHLINSQTAVNWVKKMRAMVTPSKQTAKAKGRRISARGRIIVGPKRRLPPRLRKVQKYTVNGVTRFTKPCPACKGYK